MAITVAHWERSAFASMAAREVAARAGESREKEQQHDGQQNEDADVPPDDGRLLVWLRLPEFYPIPFGVFN